MFPMEGALDVVADEDDELCISGLVATKGAGAIEGLRRRIPLPLRPGSRNGGSSRCPSAPRTRGGDAGRTDFRSWGECTGR
jgi:hypothetical protein